MGMSCQDRYNIGPKLIMLRLYISLMRGNMEKCREIAKYHCNFVHASMKMSENATNDQFASSSNVPTPLPSSSRNAKMVTAGGSSKI